MNDHYKILHLEDVQSDAELIARELKKNNIKFERLVIETEGDYIHALEHFSPDIVLCDHTLPSFNSLEALRILKEKKLYIPFILITATMTEDLAMSAIGEGADDFIFKDRLKRLPYAFINAVEKYRFEKDRMQLINMTYRKEAVSKELLRKNAEEREVLLAELTKSIKDLKQFTYITSHNFRAPLSNLVGLLKLIDDSSLCENNRGVIDMFRTATGQLNKTINDLVQILIIRNNVNIEFSDNNIDALLNEICGSLAFDINETNCIINKDLRVENIVFHQSYLESILMNLLSNAIKYRSPERTLQIDIATSLNAKGEVLLTIRDNGLGIDLKRHRNNMFGLYQRFHSNPDGIGLGLFIVKSQITSLGGSIEVESDEEIGTTFFITFREKVSGKKEVQHLALAHANSK